MIRGKDQTTNWEREGRRISERPNAEILINQSSLTVTGIINYHIKQHLTSYIDEVMSHSRHDNLTGS